MLKNKLILSVSAISLCSILLLSACGENSAAKGSSSAVSAESSSATETTDKNDSDDGISVNKGMLSVEIVLPSTFFQDKTEDEVVSTAKENGIDAKKNDDGSYTYKMSKSKYSELLDTTKESINEYLSEIPNSGNFESIKKVESDEEYENFKIYVDKDKYENSFDSFVEMGLYMQSAYYHDFKGDIPDKFQVHFTIIDNSNNSEISTDVYPTDEMLQQSETGSNQ